ncbi:unnamed protein product [Scytosiphon promiscuus]
MPSPTFRARVATRFVYMSVSCRTTGFSFRVPCLFSVLPDFILRASRDAKAKSRCRQEPCSVVQAVLPAPVEKRKRSDRRQSVRSHTLTKGIVDAVVLRTLCVSSPLLGTLRLKRVAS